MSNPNPSPFRLQHAAPISLGDFVDRLVTYFRCSDSSVVVAAIYLERLYNEAPELFDTHSTHKLVLTSLVLATKFTDDFVCHQPHYARCGGIDVVELNHLESVFASALKFTLFVHQDEHEAAITTLTDFYAATSLGFDLNNENDQIHCCPSSNVTPFVSEESAQVEMAM